ncbi:hypothetical protein [Azospirillum canadense]|uniref:hypothetical protein n=1 Tax=Azospirillum canadense TaxID=403962 RepID=UPI002227FFFC|nr:hypothetical protein [Azospirillum canadense]MCW2242766.1 hypothetical protein [Azospirillum canadense]MCW2243608.1 hypothetical protein [Azospirillum canadense]
MDTPSVYHVGPFATTDLEPTRGWYVSRLTDDGEPNGPFVTRERAEAWLEEALHGLTLDRRCA